VSSGVEAGILLGSETANGQALPRAALLGLLAQGAPFGSSSEGVKQRQPAVELELHVLLDFEQVDYGLEAGALAEGPEVAADGPEPVGGHLLPGFGGLTGHVGGDGRAPHLLGYGAVLGVEHGADVDTPAGVVLDGSSSGDL
jgi:hypothetical protein